MLVYARKRQGLQTQELRPCFRKCVQADDILGNTESGSVDNEPHEDMDIGKFSDLVHSKEQRRQLSMYNKRHKN